MRRWGKVRGRKRKRKRKRKRENLATGRNIV